MLNLSQDKKIKLKIDSFIELAKYIENLYEEMKAQKRYC